MKTYKTAEELLEQMIDLHGRFADKFKHAAKECPDDRCKMGLEYIGNHQQKMVTVISRLLEDHSKVLDTWLAYTFNEIPTPTVFFDKTKVDSSMNLEAMLDSGQEIIDYSEQLYGDVAAVAPAIELKEIFSNLIIVANNEHRQLTRAINSLRDI